LFSLKTVHGSSIMPVAL